VAWLTFANVTELDTPNLDTMFTNVGALTVIPCTANGTNTIVLTPIANTPPLSSYTSGAPVFAFLAAATSTGSVTVNVAGIGAQNLYKQHGGTQVGANDLLSGHVYYCGFNSTIGGFVLLADQTATVVPAVQVYLTGSGTYTTPAGATYLFVKMVGSGSGGGASTGGNGSNTATDTSFGSWTALHGTFGNGNGGAGGTGGGPGVNGVGTQLERINGQDGGYGATNSSAGVVSWGGIGGSTSFYGGGGRQTSAAVGATAKTNSGGGGSGGSPNGGSVVSGGGGGAGESVSFLINAPAATYAYVVGAHGTGGTGGGNNGGDGADGRILVMAYF
jgi:hypothetical protein